MHARLGNTLVNIFQKWINWHNKLEKNPQFFSHKSNSRNSVLVNSSVKNIFQVLIFNQILINFFVHWFILLKINFKTLSLKDQKFRRIFTSALDKEGSLHCISAPVVPPHVEIKTVSQQFHCGSRMTVSWHLKNIWHLYIKLVLSFLFNVF